LRVFCFLALLQRLLGRYKKKSEKGVYCILKVKLQETQVTYETTNETL